MSTHTLRARIATTASILAMNLRLRFSEVVGVLVLAIVGVLLFLGWLMFSNGHRGSNYGLGPEWLCDGKPSALVCIKHPSKAGD